MPIIEELADMFRSDLANKLKMVVHREEKGGN
jgi:hypothetical protein